jgi:hypothetical protein
MVGNILRKGLVIGIIILFIGMSIIPSSGNIMTFDDTTPPVSTHTLDPSEPDGLKGWYVSDVNVTLNATDDMSGVKEILYEINGEPGNITGDHGMFTITKDFDYDDLYIEYWAIDNAGNEEIPHNNFTIDMDQTKPIIDLTYEIIGGNRWDGWDLLFTAHATDETSGMDRVEFFYNGELVDTIIGPGPEYSWELHWYPNCTSYRVRGFIRNLEITEELVNFYAILVSISGIGGSPNMIISARGYDNAGNSDFDSIRSTSTPVNISPGIYLFQNLKLPNNYTGHVGRFFIWAEFKQQ